MFTDDNHSPPRRIHRPSLAQLLRVMLVTGFILILCPSGLVFLVAEEGIGIIFMIVVFVTQLMLYFLFVSSRIRVITSAEGIEYHQLGWRIKSAWADVDSIRTIKFGVSEREGLMLADASIELGWMHRFFARGSAAERDLRKRFIPFTPLLRNWRKEALGRDIQQYAPHLFTAELIEKKREADRQQALSID